MARIIQQALGLLWMMSVFICHAHAQAMVPSPLEPWIEWVQDTPDIKALKCPMINRTQYQQPANHVCAWPSKLTLAVTSNRGEFSQTWQVLTDSLVPLPGDQKTWPMQVTANQKIVPVVNHKGAPTILLSPGQYQVSGLFQWQTMPENLTIPSIYPFVELSINQQNVAFSKVENNQLWFNDTGVTLADQDALEVWVSRKITDGPLIRSETIVELTVSGKMREVALGKALITGFNLAGIEGDLPAFLDTDGILWAKLKPGQWQLRLFAYADPSLLSWQRPPSSAPWPTEEVWVFAADETQRIGRLDGADMIDSNLTDIPDTWRALPSYLVSLDDQINYHIQHRGKPLYLKNQLNLSRTLWLSFDRNIYSFSDRVSGNMISDWRLSMAAPYLLEAAEDQDGAVLITSLQTNERGIENRYPKVDIRARGQLEAQSEMPISGWKNDFEQVNVTLNIPPGNKLFAAFGADSVSSSWWTNWTIWASFIVLLSAVAASRLFGVVCGVITALMLICIYQEQSAPIVSIINLLIASAIKRYQPFNKIRTVATGYWIASVVLAASTILLFAATQLRTVIHPQLEQQERYYAEDYEQEMADGIAIQSSPSLQKKYKHSGLSNEASTEQIVITGSRIRAQDLIMERYQADAVIQAGSGKPNWNWNTYQIKWTSPVSEEQTMSLVILSTNTYRVLKLTGVILLLIWLSSVLRDSLSNMIAKVKPATLTVLACLLMVPPLLSPSAEAANFPSPELLEQLRERLTQAPLCAPECASITQLQVAVDDHRLHLTMSVHANDSTAIALPRSEFWRPEVVNKNNLPSMALLNRDHWLYIPVEEGVSEIELTGELAPVEIFQLEFKEKPKHITLSNPKSWEILGVDNNSLMGNTLEFFFTQTNNASAGDIQLTRLMPSAYVKVTRSLTIDKTWVLHTKVERIAPIHGSINLVIPLLEGEHPDNTDMTLEDNGVKVTIPAGEHSFSWHATMDRREQQRWTANASHQQVEYWNILVSPSWHTQFSGLPMILNPQDNDEYYHFSFNPHHGESLQIQTQRPDVAAGNTLAIDRVNYIIAQGARSSNLELSFNYRSTRGGEHRIDLPEDYQLKQIMIDAKIMNLQPEQGKLALPILPGEHTVKLNMQASHGTDTVLKSPNFNLNAPISNIHTRLTMGNERWILWAQGPVLGPAILYWGELLSFILIAALLAKFQFSPLTRLQWIILGLGLSLTNWTVLVILALWFAALTASQYRQANTSPWVFNLSQLGLYVLSFIAVMSLIGSIPNALLSHPDMGIAGNYSNASELRWFADKANGHLPSVSVLSIPNLVYKGIMLAWVLWLSFMLLNWIKWAWHKLGSQGYWRNATNNTQVQTHAQAQNQQDKDAQPPTSPDK